MDIHTLHTTITPLGRKTRVHVMLPPGDRGRNERFGVLYFHDGQEIFRDEDTADGHESLRLAGYYDRFGAYMPRLILVGIESPEDRPDRTAMLSPFTKHIPVQPGRDHESDIQGQGDRYLDWITNVLKPQIDSAYPTRPEAEHTGIAGFSSGALNSLYAGLTRPDYFTRVIAISPATTQWSDCLAPVLRRADYGRLRRVYLDVGTSEFSRMSGKDDYLRAGAELSTALTAGGLGPDRLLYSVVHRGTHSNQSWRPRLPDAIRWIFPDTR